MAKEHQDDGLQIMEDRLDFSIIDIAHKVDCPFIQFVTVIICQNNDFQQISFKIMPKKKVGEYAYDPNDLIGQGQYGKVYEAQRITNKVKYAVKVINKSTIHGDFYIQKALLRQIQIMKALKSPNIIQFQGLEQSKSNIYIFQQLAKDGNLRQLIKNSGYIEEMKAIEYIRQIVNGFGVIVSHGIIHRDLKPANVLVKDNVLKLADFGFARYSETMCFINSAVGSPAYMAPQVLNREKYSHYSYKCDIWSFGVVCYEMLFGKVPWSTQPLTEKQFFLDIQRKSIEGITFPQNIQVSEDMKNLIRGCLRYQQKDRFDWTQVFLHPVLHGLQEIDQSLDIQKVFALTRLRMSIHSKNLNIYKLFQSFPQKMSYQSFASGLKMIDNQLQVQELQCIFKSINDQSPFIIKKQLLELLEKHGIKLQGMKFSNLVRADLKQLSIIDESVQMLIMAIEQKGINIEALFIQFDKDKSGFLNYGQFHNMICSICPNSDQKCVAQIFRVFDIEKKGQVDLKTFSQKICKLAMRPNLN